MFVTASCVLVTMTALALWASGLPRLFCALIGILAGYAAVEIQVGSDSFDVRITLKYTGNLPALPDARPKRELVEVQSFVSGLTGYLSGLHADRLERSARGEACEIKLFFRL